MSVQDFIGVHSSSSTENRLTMFRREPPESSRKSCTGSRVSCLTRETDVKEVPVVMSFNVPRVLLISLRLTKQGRLTVTRLAPASLPVGLKCGTLPGRSHLQSC